MRSNKSYNVVTNMHSTSWIVIIFSFYENIPFSFFNSRLEKVDTPPLDVLLYCQLASVFLLKDTTSQIGFDIIVSLASSRYNAQSLMKIYQQHCHTIHQVFVSMQVLQGHQVGYIDYHYCISIHECLMRRGHVFAIIYVGSILGGSSQRF